MKSNIKLTAIIKCILVGICIICLSGCGSKEEGSFNFPENPEVSESVKEFEVTAGEYYLNGKKSERCITIKDHTLQFINCDINSWVETLMSDGDDTSKSPDDQSYFNQITKEVKDVLSKPAEYKTVDRSGDIGKEVYINLSATEGSTLTFKYVTDSRGTSLILGADDKVEEYILTQ